MEDYGDEIFENEVEFDKTGAVNVTDPDEEEHHDEDQSSVPEWSELMAGIGQDWEMYNVETEDGWTLTLFRLTGYEIDQSKGPILIVHGAGMDAHSWV